MTGHRRAAAEAPAAAGEARAGRATLAAYAVFRERHYEPYLHYAALRIGRHEAAETAVTAAFTELAVSWTAVLGSAGPAAIAWRILHHHIDHALGLSPGQASGGRPVWALLHDVHLLHQEMHLSCERIAEVVGLPPDQVLGLLPPATQD
ncbi:hypothetical protein [Streptomyces sp. TLI_185]|uniref:hypothetical protein n=1 Tax=Streptomyces sp. TLI_185 TaxID=2485151 RepID=UPI000F515AE8|nr:hypothetical protein [Streptomyces sp. TLI_185]RPF39347.1 hypothetical protein EDD92_9593 [Streptomyces sp. TLI_185]